VRGGDRPSAGSRSTRRLRYHTGSSLHSPRLVGQRGEESPPDERLVLARLHVVALDAVLASPTAAILDRA
jgi:hypothetical protein